MRERQGPDGEGGGVVVDKLERKVGHESNHQQPVHRIIPLDCGALDIHATGQNGPFELPLTYFVSAFS
jgi:hypothetical protein